MRKSLLNIGAFAAVVLVFSSCTKNEDSPGVEYMPDMYRSPAVEAYVDYGEIRNQDRPELRVLQSAKVPPAGTIPYYSDPVKAKVNMPLPFKAPFGSDGSHGLYGWDMYASGEESTQALNEVVRPFTNPIEYSEDQVAQGKEIYTRMCTQCHGEAADGKGPLVQNGHLSGVANLTEAPNCKNEDGTWSDGLLFYYITYGKGVMGAHGMLLTREERWQVVHFLRSLQDSDYPNVTVEVEEPVEGEEDLAEAGEEEGAGEETEGEGSPE